VLADPVRAADGVRALFRGGHPEEIEDGAALVGAALIQFASGKWPAAPPPGDDSED
jgi:hypothetical protein